MKKNSLIALLCVMIFAPGGYFIIRAATKQAAVLVLTKQTTDTLKASHINNSTAGNAVQIPLQNDSSKQSNFVPANWKIYSNDKLGFAFQYPGIWSKNGKETNVTDLTGSITEIDIQFTDTASKTTLLVAYHLPPGGKELYRYASSQYHASKGWYAAGAKEIDVAGNKAIMASTIAKIDGRGKAMVSPLRSIIADLPDKQQTGTIEFQFQTPATGEDKQVAMFYQLLSGFKFTH